MDMQYIAPLLQTVLWVVLIAVTLWKFYSPLYGLLSALHKRVEGGSNIKAGPFELTNLKPQDPVTQLQRASAEVEEVIDAQNATPVTGIPESREVIKAKYFQSEDLVMRAIQAEYGAVINRNVSAGPDLEFDGAFTTNGRLNIVEVKFLRGPSGNVSRLLSSLERLESQLNHYRWGNVQLILAVVFERAQEVPRATEILKSMTTKLTIPVVVRCFSLSELQAQFGVGDTANG